MTRPLRVLVVDDEAISRHGMVQQLLSAGYHAEAVEDAPAALERFSRSTWDVVLTDLKMPGMDGIELLRELKRRASAIDVVLMTAFATVQTAVMAMQSGAADYLTKPFSFAELDFRLRRLQQMNESRSEVARLRGMLGGAEATHGILGSSPEIGRIRERIERFAASDAPVLVTGETGTGKELIARALHSAGARTGAFVAVPCGAIPRELAESELFGHEKGAFTGAAAQHRGYFERAAGGTLLLDDVDDLPLEVQVKLLRVLQDGTLQRVGGAADLRVDVRIVATTKIFLERAVEEGRFRADLLYRLRGLEIALPPLRDRGDDVVLLAQHFLHLLEARGGSPPKSLAPETLGALRGYRWPGNVRELWRAVESAAAMCAGTEIGVADLPAFLTAGRDSERPYELHLGALAEVRLGELVRDFEDDVIAWAMRRAHGAQGRAAELLGVPRTTLQSKLGRRKGD